MDLQLSEGVVNALDTYWESEKLWILENTQVRLKPNVLSKLNNVNFNKVALHFVEEKSNDPTLTNIIIRILDHEGQEIVSSKNSPSGIPLSPEARDQVLNGQSRFDARSIETAKDKFLF